MWQAIAIFARDIEQKGIIASTEEKSLEYEGEFTLNSEENDILTSEASSGISTGEISILNPGGNGSTLLSEGEDVPSIADDAVTSYEHTGGSAATSGRHLRKKENERMIVGGSIAPLNRYPYMVEIYPKPGCGGSLIHPRVSR